MLAGDIQLALDQRLGLQELLAQMLEGIFARAGLVSDIEFAAPRLKARLAQNAE